MISRLLGLVPGVNRAGLIMRAIGLDQVELSAVDSILASVRSAPIFRSLPEGVIPGSFSGLVTLVTGAMGIGAVEKIPAVIRQAVSIPFVRQLLATEVERFIEEHPDRDVVYRALGKIFTVALPDAKPDAHGTFASFLDAEVISKLQIQDPPATGVYTCRNCGSIQVVDYHATTADCRFCQHTQVLSS